MGIDRRGLVTGIAASAAAAILPALATPRRSVAPVRATRSGLLYDDRYYHFPDDVGDLVLDIGQNSTWHYHPFTADTEGVLRHVSSGLTFVTVPAPSLEEWHEPPYVELLRLGSAPAVDSARLTMIGYAAQTSAMTGFVESFKDGRRLLPHRQQAFYFRFLDEEAKDNPPEDPQWTTRLPAPPLLANEGDSDGVLWVYPYDHV
jgi:hypothetical protein